MELILNELIVASLNKS